MRRGKITHDDGVWADWLSDEPLPSRPDDAVSQSVPQQSTAPQSVAPQTQPDPRERLRHADVPPAPAQAAAQQSAAGLSIQIHVPSFQRPAWTARLMALPWRQIRSYVVVSAACMVLAVGTRAALTLLPDGAKPKDVKGTSTTGDAAAAADAKPTYAPLVPESKKDLADPAAGKAAYDSMRSLYKYNDTLNGANLVVSQQPLPKNFKDRPEEIATMAASIGAKQSFETAFGEAYMSTKEEAGDQRLVFAYRDRLIFINSDKRFDSESWKLYIESLRMSN